MISMQNIKYGNRVFIVVSTHKEIKVSNEL